MIASIINMKSPRIDDYGEIISLILSILMMPGGFIGFFLFSFTLYRKPKTFRRSKTKKRFGDVLDDIRIKNLP